MEKITRYGNKILFNGVEYNYKTASEAKEISEKINMVLNAGVEVKISKVLFDTCKSINA